MKRLLLAVCLTVMMVFAAASGAQAIAVTELTELTYDITSDHMDGTGGAGTPSRVPEASALVLLGTGLVGLVVWRRKKRFE